MRVRGRRAVAAAAGLAMALGTLAGCSSFHQTLGTTDAPCYVTLPTANKAVGSEGELAGVQLRKVASLASLRRLDETLVAAGITTGRVCLVAFTGHFSATRVSHPSGRPEGKLAVVILRYPDGRLISTVIFRKLPTHFGHSHLG